MAELYTLYFGETSGDLDLVAASINGLTYAVPTPPLDYDTTYYWRVDATNDYGTTTGDEWSFTTFAYDPPHSIYRYREAGVWGPAGTLVPDGTAYNASTMYVTGENFIAPGLRQLVAAANNAIWYEAVTT